MNGTVCDVVVSLNTGIEILIFAVACAIMVYFLRFMNSLKAYQRQPMMYFFLEGMVLFVISSALRFYYGLSLMFGGDVAFAESIRVVSKILLISAYLVFLGMSWLLYDVVRRI